MASNINSEELNSEYFTVEALRPRIKSFFQQMPSEQLELLLKGEPDFSTKTLLAEMLLEIIDVCARSVLCYLEAAQIPISEEEVSAAIADTLPRSFAEVLELREPDQMSCDSAEQLKNLMAKEVVESVKSLSASADSLTGAPRITPPERLNNMMNATVSMIKGSMERLSGTSLRSSSRKSATTSRRSSVNALQSLKSVESQRSNLSFKKSTGSAGSALLVVRSIILEALQDITEPLTDTMMPDSYEELQNCISVEMEKISSHISSIIEAEQSMQEKPPSIEQSAEKRTSLAGKVKAFFARQFAKASIFRICRKIEEKSDRVLEVESRESAQAIVEAVDSLLSEIHSETQDEEEEVGSLTIPEGKTLYFTKALTDLLYERSTEIVPTELSFSDPEYVDIHHRVVLFLSLVHWWLNTQSGPHSRQVLQALTDLESLQSLRCTDVELFAPFVEAPMTPETVEEPENPAKAYVALVVNRSVARAFRKAKLDYSYDDLQRNFKWLVEEVWSQLQQEDLNVTSDRYEGLHKGILKDLLKKWGHLDHVLVSLDQETPQISACIAASIKQRLQKKKRSGIRGFFCSLGRALSRPFRRSQ